MLLPALGLSLWCYLGRKLAKFWNREGMWTFWRQIMWSFQVHLWFCYNIFTAVWFMSFMRELMEALFVVKSKNPKTYVMEGFPWYRNGQQTTCTLFGMHVFFSVRKGTDARLGPQPKMGDSLKCHTSCKTQVSCHHPANGGKNKYIFSNQSKLNIRLKVVVGALKSSSWRIVKCVNSKKNKA